jgi:hypothetical protein
MKGIHRTEQTAQEWAAQQEAGENGYLHLVLEISKDRRFGFIMA